MALVSDVHRLEWRPSSRTFDSPITGVVKAGVRIRSLKNNNRRDSYGKLKARLYIRVNCGGCEGTSHLSVSRATVQIEKASGEVVKEKTIHGANLNKGRRPTTIYVEQLGQELGAFRSRLHQR